MDEVILAAILRGKRLFVVDSQGTLELPGGIKGKGEKDLDALSRIVTEMLGTQPMVPQMYKSLTSHNFYTRRESEIKVYLAQLSTSVSLARSLSGFEWVANEENNRLSELSKKVIRELTRDYYMSVPFSLGRRSY